MDEGKLCISISKNKAQEILRTLYKKEQQEIEFLGESWIEGYKTGIIDTLIMLGISESELSRVSGSQLETCSCKKNVAEK